MNMSRAAPRRTGRGALAAWSVPPWASGRGGLLSRLIVVAVVMLVGGLLVGCEDQDTATAPKPDPVSTDRPVCGLIDERLVEEILVDDAEYQTRGPGAISEAERERTGDPARCAVVNQETGQTMIEVAIGEARQPAKLRQQLRAAAEATPPCVVDYTGGPTELGTGYGWHGCYPYNEPHPDGVGVHVVRGNQFVGHWLVRVALPADVVHPSPPDRLTIAEEIASNIQTNLLHRDQYNV